MLKVILSLIITITAIASFAEIIDYPKNRVAPEDFSIMPWGHLWLNNQENKDEIYQDMYDCGFNLTCTIPPEDVKYAKKHNLKAIIQDTYLDRKNPDLTARALNYVNKIKAVVGEDLDAVYQVYVQDEPPARDDTIKELAAYSEAIRKVLGAEPYINLLPNYAHPAAQWFSKSYDEYLEKLITGVNLTYLSYDHYAFSMGKPGKAKGYAYNQSTSFFNEDGFYGNLESVRTASQRHNIRFINIIQSIAAMNWPTPTEFIIGLQGWSTLAYGGKGLAYFTFYTPNIGNWTEAPHDAYGMKSPTWRYVAHMNYAIHNIAPIYTKLKNVNVYHIGNVPKGSKDKSSAQVLKDIKMESVCGKINVLVGEFLDKDGKNYAIVVNKDAKSPIMILDLKFAKGTNIKKVEERTLGNQTKDFGGEGTFLDPGQGVLLYAE